MNERIDISKSELWYKPHEERLSKLTLFRGNLQTFLDNDIKNATLLDIPFVADIFKLVVANKKYGYQAPFAYEKLDEDICNLYLNRLKKSNKEGSMPPIIINETFSLAEFTDMPEKLKPFIGKSIKVVSNIHELVSAPNEGIFVTQARYFAPSEEIMPTFERWSAQRSNFEPDRNADYTIDKMELILPS